jgi:dTDP-4-amino-4,6-dideoxygalactose transaminase
MKVLIPDMPTADELLPYLRRIDAARWYSNGGPMVQELEKELTEITRAPTAVVSNGTVALELALRALQLPPGAEVLVPAATFRATGMAVLNAGLRPVLADVDSIRWQLRPDPGYASRRGVRAVVPVATFGMPVDAGAWATFAAVTGLPVVIDAAGALLGQIVPMHTLIAVVFSMHATKAIGAGEGGAVSSHNTAWRDFAARAANFGYGGDDVGTNGKLSEYHAAVALASLRTAEARGLRALLLHNRYVNSLPPQCQQQRGPMQSFRTLLPVLMPDWESANAARRAFTVAGIETREWYAPFLHEQALFAACARVDDLKFTHQLAVRTIGLPFHKHLTSDDVQQVCTVLAEAINKQ